MKPSRPLKPKVTEPDVSFPITAEAFEALALEIVKKFNVPDNEETRELIGNCILTAPVHVAASSLSLIGAHVRKGFANKVAWETLQVFKQRRIKEDQEKAAQEKKLAETSQSSANAEPVQK